MLRAVSAGTGSLIPPSMRTRSPIRRGEKIHGAEKLARMAIHKSPSVTSTRAPVAMSVASVALRGEPTGVATGWNADVVATAKRDLAPGERLDGEGGYTVWGKLLPSSASQQLGGVPLGLAHDVKVVRPVRKGQPLSWDDVAMDTGTPAYKVRREMESMFAR